MEGVRIEDMGHKMGCNGVDNGKLWFDRESPQILCNPWMHCGLGSTFWPVSFTAASRIDNYTITHDIFVSCPSSLCLTICFISPENAAYMAIVARVHASEYGSVVAMAVA